MGEAYGPMYISNFHNESNAVSYLFNLQRVLNFAIFRLARSDSEQNACANIPCCVIIHDRKRLNKRGDLQ